MKLYQQEADLLIFPSWPSFPGCSVHLGAINFFLSLTLCPDSDVCLSAVRHQVLFILLLKHPLEPTVSSAIYCHSLSHTLVISRLHSWVPPPSYCPINRKHPSSGSMRVTHLTPLFRTQTYLCGPPLMASFLRGLFSRNSFLRYYL